MATEYGRCPCRGRYMPGEVEVPFAVGASMQGVPRAVCPECDSRVYPAHVLAMLDAVYRAREREVRPP
jgi:hypothetical protein